MDTAKNEEIGEFISALRKEKDMTQKKLAEKLFVSDKAVSKWERGLSMPDVSLLIPLSQVLGVTATELLCGKRMESDERLSVGEVESLMSTAIDFSLESGEQQKKVRGKRAVIFVICTAGGLMEIAGLLAMGNTFETLAPSLVTIELLTLIFGVYFTFFAKEKLPSYYDGNKINYYSDGFLRLNMQGVNFNNSNWKHIVNTAQTSMALVFAAFPAVFFFGTYFAPEFWAKASLAFTFAAAFCFLVPIYVAAKKYE